jgi:uncharacterized Zn finger protein
MPRYSEEWAPYVSVAERRKQAEREIEKLRKKGHPVAPVVIEGRAIVTTFWGKAWCDNLGSYHDFETRLPRGRSYVRNGSVLDLQIAPLAVTALVSGTSIYKVTVAIEAAPKAHWQSICRDCAGGIDSLVELLQGRFSKGVMERLCRQDNGLFPRPSEIKFSCSCPDYAALCKHVAAVLYGVGARLDEKPELLFRLRAVDESDLLANLDTVTPLSATKTAAGKILEADDFSALFGLDMADGDAPVAPQKKGRTRSKPVEPRTSQPMKTAARKVPSRKPAKPARTPVKAAAPPAVQPAAPAKKAQNRAEPAAPAKPASKRRVPGRLH